MRKILKSKCGVTILEGLIALTLLALVATGTFAVLLSTSRKSAVPDLREEMILAVEKVSRKIQMYIAADGTNLSSLEHVGSYSGASVLSSGSHSIKDELPPICDSSKSDFTYTVSLVDPASRKSGTPKPLADDLETVGATAAKAYEISFSIKCNGYTL